MADDTNDDSENEVTTIKVSRDTWRRLNRRKTSPNESFDDIVQSLLEKAEGGDEGNLKMAATAD